MLENIIPVNPAVYFLRTRNVKMPDRGTDYAAGIDFYMPEIDNAFVEEFNKMNYPENAGPFGKTSAYIVTKYGKTYVCVPRGARVLIPSGVKSVIFPKNSMLLGENKTGMACKNGAQVTAQVVDSDYTGEIYVGFVNTWEHDQSIMLSEGDKIGQYIHVPVYLSKPQDIDEYWFNKMHAGSERGEGAFGSTDKKEQAS